MNMNEKKEEISWSPITRNPTVFHLRPSNSPNFEDWWVLIAHPINNIIKKRPNFKKMLDFLMKQPQMNTDKMQNEFFIGN